MNLVYMVIMNHQSLLDIIVIEYIHSRDLAWVAKKEITDLFFWTYNKSTKNDKY